MVFAVYSHNPKVEIDSSGTVDDLIGLVRPIDKEGPFVVLYNGQLLSGSTILSSIPGLKETNTLRVIHDMRNSKPQHPPANSVHTSFNNRLGDLPDHDIQKLADFIGDPSFKRKFLLKYSELANDNHLLNLLADFTQWEHGVKTYPGLEKYVKIIFDTALPKGSERQGNPNLLAQMQDYFAQRSDLQPRQAAPPVQQQQPIISQDFLQSAFNSVLQNQAPSPQAAPAPAAPAQATASQPPEVLYREQLQQFHEFGFFDDQQNIQYLVASGGNFQAALELLIQEQE